MNRFWRKLTLNAIIVVPLLMWFTEAGFFASLITSVILSAISYFVGDQWILRATNNTVATLADAGIAYLYLWFVADFYDWALTAGELFWIVLGLAIVEWIFHRQLAVWDAGEDRRDQTRVGNPQFTSEFAEEMDLDRARKADNPADED